LDHQGTWAIPAGGKAEGILSALVLPLQHEAKPTRRVVEKRLPIPIHAYHGKKESAAIMKHKKLLPQQYPGFRLLKR
jgi:hypothetical protein